MRNLDQQPQPSLSWWQDEPARLRLEREQMLQAAPDLRWLEDEPSGGWEGPVPLWPFERPAPFSLSASVPPLQVRIVCGHAFPMCEPRVVPLNTDLPTAVLGWTAWHVAPDMSLCLLQEASSWDPRDTCAQLIPKISGWYLEFLLMSAGRIEAMTVHGITANTSLDPAVGALIASREGQP